MTNTGINRVELKDLSIRQSSNPEYLGIRKSSKTASGLFCSAQGQCRFRLSGMDNSIAVGETLSIKAAHGIASPQSLRGCLLSQRAWAKLARLFIKSRFWSQYRAIPAPLPPRCRLALSARQGRQSLNI